MIRYYNYIFSENSDYELKVRNELSTLFGILNQFRKNIEETFSLQTPNYRPEKRVQVLLDYIHTHYKDKITIEGLAKKASISKTEVLRCFKSIIGLSPINYLNSYRLQRAAYLLIHSENNNQSGPRSSHPCNSHYQAKHGYNNTIDCPGYQVSYKNRNWVS